MFDIRNKAAHDEVLRRDEARQTRSWAMQILGQVSPIMSDRLVDALDLSDWEALEIDDPVEWVKALRRQDESRLDPYWDGSR